MSESYQDVFEAEVRHDGSEFSEGNRLPFSIITIGDFAEINVFERGISAQLSNPDVRLRPS
jgi:hypothetical protein